MFSLHISRRKDDGWFNFTIVRPDGTAMAGSRKNRKDIFEELEEHMDCWASKEE